VDGEIENIFDSADRPLKGNRWWLQASSPWQCLAACMELTKALRSVDPLKYICRLPIHQDGTCNGLQHYAALGGDVLGGSHVNLLPSEKPQDVYSGVAAIVRKRIEEDASSGDVLAQKLIDKVDRKVVKQTVMTSVYGVTFVGARRQIEGQLKDRALIAEEDRYKASIYLSKLVFASLGEIFSGARAIMDWLARCAKLIASEAHTEVSWPTPLGLRVIQPYRAKGSQGNEYVKTIVQTMTLKNQEEQKIAVQKQRTAFPPNYIHSLDSSHMFLTANRMDALGLTFASVHDSYWTHASTVDDMNRMLREQFVELHKRPLLKDLLRWWQNKYPKIDFPPLPER